MYKTALIIGFVICLLFTLLGNSKLLRRFEHIAYDLSVYLSLSRVASDKIVIVAVDDAAIEHYGPWPWSREIFAAAQRRINAGNPKAVAYTVSFEAAHNERGLEIMGEFRNENADSMGPKMVRRFQKALNRLDSDYSLALSFRNSGKVLLGLQYGNGPVVDGVSERLQPYLNRSTVTDLGGEFSNWPSIFRPPLTESAARFYLPNLKVGDEAAAWAAGNDYLNDVRGPRAMPLLVPFGDGYIPGLALLVVGLLNGDNPNTISLHEGKEIKIGRTRIASDNAGRIYPYFYKMHNAEKPIRVYSIKDVASGGLSENIFKDKAVLIGLTASRFAETHPTPLGIEMTPVELLAHSISSLLQNDLYRVTGWSYLFRYAGVLLVTCYLMLLLPRLAVGTGLAISTLIAVLLLNVEVILMLTQSVWAPMMLAVAALVCGHLFIELNRVIYNRIRIYKQALTESNLQLARTLQSQGQLDNAFTKYRHCLVNDDVLYSLYRLGEDYERKRQFKRAAEVFQYINSQRRKYRDAEERIAKNEQLDNTVVLGGSAHTATQTLILTNNGVQKPVLGRYEIDRELGRGAMGVVYLGKDPKIGRTVAIKTLSFSQEFDEDVAVDIKEHFHREAATAGRLNHPGIVTIYDVGEEQDLSYIAMDYLEGEPMSGFVKPKTLLPVETVLEAIAQVADALHYAHSKSVVHRDIKPENIILDVEAGSPTITDFGVACLTDAGKTKTGAILGSPSYMSPEQLSGERVDGRTDLFSLGITLYQLLTGTLPFTADSIPNLMYKISTSKHPSINTVRQDLPACVVSVINKSLQKKPDKRYADGRQMADALRNCLAKSLKAND